MELVLTGLAAVAGLYAAMVLLRRVWREVRHEAAGRWKTPTDEQGDAPGVAKAAAPSPPQVFSHLIAAFRERAAREREPGAQPTSAPGGGTPLPEERERLREMVLAQLQPFSEVDRAAWERRCLALARRIVEAQGDLAGPACAVWESAMRSLAALPGPVPDAPAWFSSRHAAEERRLLEAYRQAHLDLLHAVLAIG